MKTMLFSPHMIPRKRIYSCACYWGKFHICIFKYNRQRTGEGSKQIKYKCAWVRSSRQVLCFYVYCYRTSRTNETMPTCEMKLVAYLLQTPPL